MLNQEIIHLYGPESIVQQQMMKSSIYLNKAQMLVLNSFSKRNNGKLSGRLCLKMSFTRRF